MDTPSEDVVERWPTTFAGWALHGSRPPQAVEVVLNATLRFTASVGSYRPDIPRNLAEPDASEHCGWEVEIDLALVPNGPLHIQAVAHQAQGESRIFVDRVVTLTGDGFACEIDEGREGERVDADTLVVGGWAVIGWRYPTRIDVEVDGGSPAPARLRLLHENQQPTGALRGRPMAGFEYTHRLTADHSDSVEVGITVVGRNGEFVRAPSIRLRAVTPPPRGELLAPEAARTRRPSPPAAQGREQLPVSFDRTGARVQLDIPSDAVVLLSCGLHEQGVDHLIVAEAFCEVAAVHPRAVLIVAGDADGPYARALRELISMASLDTRIVTLPMPSDNRPLVALADILVSASDVDAISQSMTHALALGVPIAAADTPRTREMIDDGVSGWLFGWRDVRALVACLYRALNLSPDRRREIGHAANLSVKPAAHHRNGDEMSADY